MQQSSIGQQHAKMQPLRVPEAHIAGQNLLKFHLRPPSRRGCFDIGKSVSEHCCTEAGWKGEESEQYYSCAGQHVTFVSHHCTVATYSMLPDLVMLHNGILAGCLALLTFVEAT